MNVEPGPAVPPREYDYSWIVKTGEYEYRLDPKALDEALSDLTIIVSQARVIPNYRGGKYQGFKLVGVRPGSIYRAMGIRSGDIIHDVDGMQIDSPNKAIELFSSLKESERVVVGIERRLNEAHRLGFRRAIVPATTPEVAVGLDVVRVSTVAEAVAVAGLLPGAAGGGG